RPAQERPKASDRESRRAIARVNALDEEAVYPRSAGGLLSGEHPARQKTRRHAVPPGCYRRPTVSLRSFHGNFHQFDFGHTPKSGLLHEPIISCRKLPAIFLG